VVPVGVRGGVVVDPASFAAAHAAVGPRGKRGIAAVSAASALT
jgi:hypothetical protein